MDRANKRGLGSLVASFLSFLKTKLKIQVPQSQGHSQLGGHTSPHCILVAQPTGVSNKVSDPLGIPGLVCGIWVP